MRAFLLSTIFLLFSAISLAQETSSIYLDGIFRNSGKARLKAISVEIVNSETGETVETLEIDGKFKKSVKLDKSYTIYFRKEGFATKKIFVEKTDVSDRNFRFQFDMEMLKIGKKVQIDSEPVAVLRYDKRRRGYIYDPKYTEKIRKEIKDKIKKS